MSLALTNRVEILQDRASMFSKARAFFATRNILEVDVPLLTEKAPIDLHIDLVQAECMGKRCYLQSSPEYGMKRLLAKGIGDIYQLSHVFRDGEYGDRHNPEFTMVEWYRIGFSFEEMIEETLEFLRLFIDTHEIETLKFDDAYKIYAPGYEKNDFNFANIVEPELGANKFTILKDFPPEQAALSKIKDGIALRFEIFWGGFELANGYFELIDPIEQKKRLIENNKKREELNKQCYPIDDKFLAALEIGLPEMCGVAVGFDRLMMLRHNVNSIDQVIPFSWTNT